MLHHLLSQRLGDADELELRGDDGRAAHHVDETVRVANDVRPFEQMADDNAATAELVLEAIGSSDDDAEHAAECIGPGQCSCPAGYMAGPAGTGRGARTNPPTTKGSGGDEGEGHGHVGLGHAHFAVDERAGLRRRVVFDHQHAHAPIVPQQPQHPAQQRTQKPRELQRGEVGGELGGWPREILQFRGR